MLLKIFSRAGNFIKTIKEFFIKISNLEKWKENKNKWPSKRQWLSFFKVISPVERFLFLIFFLIMVGFLIFYLRLLYLENTKVMPASGGILKEVIVGYPYSLNPLFSLLNDSDRDLSELLFSGLLRYNEKGNLEKDLAEDYKVLENGKIYEFTLKENIFFSDGKKIDTEDILFTLELIKNPEVQSPLRSIWQEIKAEKIDHKTLRFILPSPYWPFFENFTLKILPEHIFSEILPQEVLLKSREQTISSGPLKIKNLKKEEEKISKIILERNPYFHRKAPYFEEMEITFIENEEDLSKKEVKNLNFGGFSPRDKKNFGKNFKIYSFFLSRYFLLFLNLENKILSQKEIRESLSLATPKKEIIENILLSEARIVEGPLLPEHFVLDYKKYDFNLEEAKKKLEENGWKDQNGDGIKEKVLEEGKEPTPLKLTLTTIEQKDLKQVIEIIQRKWQEAGVSIEFQILKSSELQEAIKERKYDILFFGKSLNIRPDLLPFWHSVQKKYPGLNLSQYENKEIDEILKKIIEEISEEQRKELLKTFAQKITENIPVIFLYSPNYLYAVSKKIKGIKGGYITDPSKRFLNIENWYINERRVRK